MKSHVPNKFNVANFPMWYLWSSTAVRHLITILGKGLGPMHMDNTLVVAWALFPIPLGDCCN